jgi:ssDNA-binding Zn-finger/Zn-ribbon topoisomerase 1
MIVAGVALLVVLTGLLTAFGAFLIWRDGFRKGWHRAREKAPTCPNCGYNLSGLRQCRCPECGKEYALDELWRMPISGRASERSTSGRLGSPEKSFPS